MDGLLIDNGAFAVGKNRFRQVGPAKDVLRDHAGEVVDLGDVVVLPGLINAHCHLEYTMMRGAILPSRSFAHWVGRINALKRNISDEDYLHSFFLGIRELRTHGVTCVLDIVASPQIFSRISAVPIRLWSFLELIDIRPKPWRDDYAFGSWLFLTQNNRALGGLGLSPHAPYTASAEIYGLAQLCAARFGMAITTHLAESQEEYEMFAFGKGALFELLAGLGRSMTDCGKSSPFRYVAQNRLIAPDCIIAHFNEVDALDLELLSHQPWNSLNIVHCPKSHRFLHHRRFPLEALRERGLNICLGTDSLASNDSLNLFSEMRFARRSYSFLTPKELLEMTTVCPARALKSEHQLGKITPDFLADAIAVHHNGPAKDAYETIIENRMPIEWMMVDGKVCG